MASYSRERLDLFSVLLQKNLDIATGRPWTIEPKELRFKHGETLAELKVPFHMGGEDETCIEQAVAGLASLLIKRFEPKADGAQAEGAQLPVSVGVLKEKTLRTDFFISDSLEKEIARRVISSTPYMDSAILANWLGSGGHGRKLINWLSDYMDKMLREEARAEGEERTSYIAFLALLNTVRKKKELVKNLRIKGLSYEKAELAIGLTLFHTIRATILRVFRKLRDTGATYSGAASETLIISALTPRSFISIQSNLVAGTLNPYGINSETFEALSAAMPAFDEYDGSNEFIEWASSRMKKEGALEAVQAQADINRFREAVLDFFSELDLPGSAIQSTLFEVHNEDRLIRNLLADQKALSTLAEGLEELKTRFSRDQLRTETVQTFMKFISGFRRSMLGSLLKGSRKPEEAAPVLEGFYAMRLDEQAETFVALMRGYLADRREEFKPNILVEEYNRGRLYRFAVDDRPVLKTLTLEEEGQLFIDMKDFTRKTLKVKEIAMADFMREYFYGPILKAASKYGVGKGVVADEKGIRLTNLPGDAAIFSGGVSYLVALAKDIQQIIRRYREELTKRLPPRKDEEVLEEVHKRFEARKETLKQKRAELNTALMNNEPGVETRLVALGEEEHRLENTYREELENAIKGELEAGLYISYGAKAETVVVESSNGEFSGPASVSIGEKINEASRGTFRNPLVRAKLEMMLETERAKKKDKQLKYPFDVYIDRVLSIKLAPELDSAFEKLLSTRKEANAKAMAEVMANEFYADLNRIISGETFSSLRVISSTKDIYNKGEALSINALEAYMRENRGTKWFFNRKVEVSSLEREIREQFFFPSESLELWLGHEQVRGADKIEVFYRSGEIIFKGFEASTPMAVFELVNPEGDFVKALVKHHFHKWLEESRREASETV